MAAKKKKRLPKDFAQRLRDEASLDELRAVFDTCDVNATEGTSGRTAMMLYRCPAELVRWLVANGADVNAADERGSTALHHQARSHASDLQVLIDAGANVHATSNSQNTPLHDAVDAKKLNHVRTLIAAGADVNARNRERLTPLEYGLQRASNADLSDLAPVAQLLLESGAVKTPAMAGFVQRLGENFEFHRGNFNPDMVVAASAGLDELYRLFDVTPVARRVMHDGRTRIAVTSKTWEEQYAELWDLLIPSSGPAQTLQGEVIRIAGRVQDEIHRNGGVNWDAEYRKMLQSFAKHIRSGSALTAEQLASCDEAMSALPHNGDKATSVLIQLAVAWVLLNPDPVPLDEVTYRR